MSKFNYVTGYLPVVIDEEIQRKQIKQRLVFGVVAIAAGLVLFSLLGNDTSAQGNYSGSSIASIDNIATLSTTMNTVKNVPVNKTEKAITAETKQTVLLQTPSTKQANQKLTTLTSVKSDKQLEDIYQKEIDDLLSKAFSQ